MGNRGGSGRFEFVTPLVALGTKTREYSLHESDQICNKIKNLTVGMGKSSER